MEYSIIQVALVFIVTFVAAIDQFNFLESLYQPIVTGAVIGRILCDLNPGLLVGGTSVRSAWSARRYPGLHAYVAAHVLCGQHGSQR